MGSRRRGREAALQILFALDIQPDLSVADASSRCFALMVEAGDPADDEARAYVGRRVAPITERRAEIDGWIRSASHNWRIERMGIVDRNLLRLAAFEMRACDDVPTRVAINEAIEVAKRYGSHETPGFVNGLLDSLMALSDEGV